MRKDKLTSREELALLVRYFTAEMSSGEKKTLDEWLARNARNKKLLDVVAAVWDTKAKPPRKSDVDGDWLKVAQKAGILAGKSGGKKKERSNLLIFLVKHRVALSMAAMALVFTMLSIIWRYSSMVSLFDTQTLEMVELQVDKGKTKRLVLDDGTHVVLDAGTVFRFPRKFDTDQRRVFLLGEGYFDVKADESKPFSVITDSAVIKVLGTRFNVASWSLSHKVAVAVFEGTVSLSSRGTPESKAIPISNGQVGILPAQGLPIVQKFDDADDRPGWINRSKYFENVKLSEIVNYLERWYDLDFRISDSVADNICLTVHIEDRPIKAILDLLADLTRLTFTLEGRTVHMGSESGKR